MNAVYKLTTTPLERGLTMTDYKDILIPKEEILDKAFFDNLLTDNNGNDSYAMDKLIQSHCYLNYATIVINLERVLGVTKKYDAKVQISWEELAYYKVRNAFQIAYLQTKNEIDDETKKYYREFMQEEYYKKISILDWEAPLEKPKKFEFIEQASVNFLTKNDTTITSTRILTEYIKYNQRLMAELKHSINANAWRLSYLFKSMQYGNLNISTATNISIDMLNDKAIKEIENTYKLMKTSLASIMAWLGLIEAIGTLLEIPSLIQYSEAHHNQLIQKSINILIAEQEELTLFLMKNKHPLCEPFADIPFFDLSISKYKDEAIKETIKIIKPYLSEVKTSYPLEFNEAKSYLKTHILEINKYKDSTIV